MTVSVVKNDHEQQPVPTAWRATLASLVSALARGDARPGTGIAGLAPLPLDRVASLYAAIRDYGAVLVPLPDETWQTSVCQWYGSHWDVLVDLWAEGEGRSDLVLGLRVEEAGDGYTYSAPLVYVP